MQVANWKDRNEIVPKEEFRGSLCRRSGKAEDTGRSRVMTWEESTNYSKCGNAAHMHTSRERAGAPGGLAKSLIIICGSGAAETLEDAACNVSVIRMGRCGCGVEHVPATPECS